MKTLSRFFRAAQICILLAFAHAAPAQTWTLTSAPNKSWSSIASSADGIKLFAAGEGIYTSTDSGGTWTQTSAPDESWSSIASSADGTQLAAAISYGGIYISTNSGGTWTLTSAPGGNWSAIASSADGTHLAAASGYGIYTSTDSGSTWALTSAPLYRGWTSIASSADGTKLAAVGNSSSDDLIFTSKDGGATWTATNGLNVNGLQYAFAYWSAVASSADGTKLVAAAQWIAEIPINTQGEAGANRDPAPLCMSTNSGSTWFQTSAPNNSWASVASSADGTILVATAIEEGSPIGGGRLPVPPVYLPPPVYLSTNSGVTWTPSIGYGVAVACSADGTKLVAAGGGIYTLNLAIPQITGQPASQALLAGTNVTLSVGVCCVAPLTYQWRFNDTNLPGATNAVLTLTNVAPSNSGSYALLAINSYGGAISSNAVLAVDPVFVETQPQPPNRTVLTGTNVTFTVSVLSLVASNYQWECDGANLPGATNASLVLTNLTLNNSGTYAVLISDSFGSVLSSNAILTVVPAFVTTLPATSLSTTSGNLNGTVANGDSEAVVWFEWGGDTNYGNLTGATVLPAGGGVVAVSSTLSGLSTNIYHYRLVAWTVPGFVYGTDEEFAVHPSVWNNNDAGDGSLRQAIQAAAPGATVNFSFLGIIILTSGELLITNDLTIIGPGATNLAISGNGSERVFEIASNATVSISGLTICNGRAPDGISGGPGGDGGGIYNAGALTLTSCTLVSNTDGNGATPGPGRIGGNGGDGGNGGGIYNAGTLTVDACAFASNSAGIGGHGGNGSHSSGGMGGSGGAIYSAGALSISSTTLSGNTAGGGGGADLYYASNGSGHGGNGGAVCSASPLAASATNCAFIGNQGGSPGLVSASPGGDGGGFYSTGPLTLVGCTFTGNQGGTGVSSEYDSSITPGVGGVGAIYAASNLFMLDCMLQANLGGPGGGGFQSYTGLTGAGGTGGVFNGGTSTITDCAIADNMGGSGGMADPCEDYELGGFGGTGGIYNAGQLTLISCTLSGNIGGSGGSGGTNRCDGNGTGGANGNGGNGGPGGVCSAGTLTLAGCTVSGNFGGNGGDVGVGSYGGAPGNGGSGAISDLSPSTYPVFVGSSAQLVNTLVALNYAGAAGNGGSAGAGPDLAGSFTSLGYNLIGQTNGSTGFTNGVNADLAGTTANPLAPLLGPLAGNGGRTPTMALLHGSPALEAGDAALFSPPYNLTTDQRGFPRQAGGHVDIGAFEFQPVATPPALITLPQSATGEFQFAFTNISGATFSVLSFTNLLLPASGWAVVGQALEVAPGQFQFTDPQTTNNPNRFYRVSSP